MDTNHVELGLISMRCQKEYLRSKLDGQTYSQSDYSAFLWVKQNFDTKSLKYCLLIISFCHINFNTILEGSDLWFLRIYEKNKIVLSVVCTRQTSNRNVTYRNELY